MSRLINRTIPFVRGKNLPLSLPRRFVGDLMHFSQKIPSIPMQRRMRLADVVAARAGLQKRISWCAIFMKAYAIVSASRPELRRTYLSFPWGHLYEHPFNIASFSLERMYQDEEAVFFARIARPEMMSLRALDFMVRAHKAAEVESVVSYKQAIDLARLPRPIRRLLMWIGLEKDGAYKAHFFGTFGVSVVASFGAAGLHLISPVTTTLNYGTFEPDGAIDVRLTYDHRVLDGAVTARALGALEDALHGQIRDELLAEPLATSEIPAAVTAPILLRFPTTAGSSAAI